MTELLLGCGFSRDKRLGLPGKPLVWSDLVTCDFNPKCKPDIRCDLDPYVSKYAGATFCWEVEEANERGIRYCERDDEQLFFKENMFHEIHAYEVLEHLGEQGNAAAFFNCFYNLHRLLRPGGHLYATCPSRYSEWAWGDPSHTRIICAATLAFLSQAVIAANRKAKSAMSDFSGLWDRDFKIVSASDNQQTFIFCLQAVK
jgi:SAM-dependent methyltransferase